MADHDARNSDEKLIHDEHGLAQQQSICIFCHNLNV